jgi:hypothetical protein
MERCWMADQDSGQKVEIRENAGEQGHAQHHPRAITATACGDINGGSSQNVT